MGNKNGDSALILVSVLLFTIIIPISTYAMNSTILLTQYDKIKQAIKVSAMGALYNVSQDTILYDTGKQTVADAFTTLFKKNLQIDDSGYSKILTTTQPITIQELVVYDAGDVPATCPQGTVISFPAIHVVVSTQFKDCFGKPRDVLIHSDIDIFER
ncbi:conserved hypothetical protein [Caldicellulosiruptor hydrothermalis 108]|uniref:Uncharacterized protein n=1 Tax=Caldicellulosiruptor hydrothermalis (strain DSM 18901 / VKM B-2411 / 108) TaxID=632292 RepID=E4QBW6_CALH1|nr:conserved hypothetical protein [Caldicellulosiruptor hydrothermalis 108]